MTDVTADLKTQQAAEFGLPKTTRNRACLHNTISQTVAKGQTNAQKD